VGKRFRGRWLFRLCFVLVGANDLSDHGAEFFVEFFESGSVLELDAFAFAADQSRFAEDFEVLGEGGFGEGNFAEANEGGAAFWAFGAGELQKDADADRVRKGIEDALDGDGADRGMVEGSHLEKLYHCLTT
jgi:hypothetical protein